MVSSASLSAAVEAGLQRKLPSAGSARCSRAAAKAASPESAPTRSWNCRHRSPWRLPLIFAGQLAQAGGAVVGGEALAGGAGGLGVVARVQQRLAVEGAVLGHEQEDQPIDHAQELAVEVGERHLAGAQGIAQRGVLRVAGEAFAEDLQRPLDAAAQVAQGAGALLVGELGPLLQPAGLGPLALARREARGVGHEPEQDEVGIDLAGEHGLEVELEKRLAREGLVVAQDAQAQAVRHDGPEVAGAAVQELLHQAVRVDGGGAAHAGGAAVEATGRSRRDAPAPGRRSG